MNTPDAIGTLNLQVTGNHEILVTLKGKIQQLINKTTSDHFNIKRQWASFFINHFLQHLQPQKNISSQKIVNYFNEIQNSKVSKQQKYTQSDVIDIMKDQTIKGDFVLLFGEWLSTHAVKIIEETTKIKQKHKDIYKKLIPDIKSQLTEVNPFKKFMSVPQMSNQPTIQGQMSEKVFYNIEIIEEKDQDQQQNQEQSSIDQYLIMELEKEDLMISTTQIDY